MVFQPQQSPFSERFEKVETLYLDPGFSQVLARDRNTQDEVRLQCLPLNRVVETDTLPLQWEALKACRDSLWLRPQEWFEEGDYGILLTKVPPGRNFNEISGTFRDEIYLQWMKDALQDLVHLHRHGLLHLAQNSKTWILFKHEEAQQESMGLSDVGILAEVPLGQRVLPEAMVAVAPEILRGQAVDARADLYALAALILRQRSTHLFAAESSLKSQVELHWKGTLVERVPETATPLNDLLRQMLQPDPAQRPANAYEALKKIEVPSSELEGRPRSFPEWSEKRTQGRQQTLILNTLASLLEVGETELTAQMLETLSDYLQQEHGDYFCYFQAKLHRLQDDLSNAQTWRERAKSKTPSTPLKTFLLLEEVKAHEDQPSQALSILSSETIEAEPELQFRVYGERGRLHKILGQDVESLSEFYQAYQLLPQLEDNVERGDVLTELGDLLTSYGLPHQAKPLFVAALAESQEDLEKGSRHYLQSALNAVARQEWELANEQFQEALLLMSRLKDLSRWIWISAHRVRLALAKQDFQEARKQLKALRSRNRGHDFHEELLDLLELELWIASGQGIRQDASDLLTRMEAREDTWTKQGFFCDVAWPWVKTVQTLAKRWKKLSRMKEARALAKQLEAFQAKMTEQLQSYGYFRENEESLAEPLATGTSLQVQSLLSDEKPKPSFSKPEPEEGSVEDLQEFRETLLHENQRLKQELEALKQQLQKKPIRPQRTVRPSRPKEVVLKKAVETAPIAPKAVEPPPPPQIQRPQAEATPVGSETSEKERIEAVLRKCQGSRSQAAKELGMHRRTLFAKLKKYDLENLDFLPNRQEMEAALAACQGNKSHAAGQLGMSRSSFYRRMKELGISD